MTKQELMKTYTAEQLAEMVVKLQSTSEVKNDEIHKFKWQISSMEEENGRLQAKLDTYNNYLLTRATKEAKEMIDHNNFGEVMIVTCEQWNNRIEKESNEADIRRYEDTIDKLQSEVEKYRKAFENAKKERDCQIAEYQKKICELTAENEKLKGNVGSKGYCDKQNKTNNFYGLFANHAKDLTKDDVLIFLGVLAKELIANGIDFRYEMGNEPKVWDIKIKSDKSISDFLPTEPIKVADMLIHNYKQGLYPVYAKDNNGQIQNIEVDGKIYPLETGEYEEYSELRQIAEHLLVYCNHNGEAEE